MANGNGNGNSTAVATQVHVPGRGWLAPNGGDSTCLCGPQGEQATGELARAVKLIRRALKSGNINQGYAQCDVDELSLAVERGECPPERIQCRQPALLRATAIPGGGGVVFTILPVGPAYARELLTLFSQPDDPVAATDFVPVVTQIAARGRTALAGSVASTGTGNVAAGFSPNAYARTFQNYVLPSGITFDASQALTVTVANVGTDPGTLEMQLTYDLIRMG